MNGHVLGTERLQELVELLLDSVGEDRAEIRDVCLAVVEVLQQLDAVTKTGEDGKLSFEGIFPALNIAERCLVESEYDYLK